MERRQSKHRFSIDLGEGQAMVIEVDIQPVLSTTSVPVPKPKLIARVVAPVGGHCDAGPGGLQLDCTFSLEPKDAAAS